MFPFDRRVYFIKKDFQARFIVRFVLSTTIWAVATVSLFTFIAERRLDDVLYSPHINIQSSIELLMPSVFLAHVISVLLFTAILVYAISALWRRLSRPLYSLKKDVARIAAGDLVGGVSLGEEEEFQDLAIDLDEMRTGLRQKFIRLKDGKDALTEAALELERAVWKGGPSVNHAAAMKKAVDRLKGELDGFTW